jgi:hypothetical protein
MEADAIIAIFKSGLTQVISLCTNGNIAYKRVFIDEIVSAAKKSGFTVIQSDLASAEIPALSVFDAINNHKNEEKLERIKSKIYWFLSYSKRILRISPNNPISAEHPSIDKISLEACRLIGEISRKRPVLFIFDNTESLANDDTGAQSQRLLRAALTKNQWRTRAVFIGSGRKKLETIFMNPNSPMYISAFAIYDIWQASCPKPH